MIDPPGSHSAVIARGTDIGVPVPIRDQSNPKLRLISGLRNCGKINRKAIGEGGTSVQGEGWSGLQGLPVSGIQHLESATGRAGRSDIKLQDDGLKTNRRSGDLQTRALGSCSLLGKTGELQSKVGIGGGIARTKAGGRSRAEAAEDRECRCTGGSTQEVVGLVKIPQNDGLLGEK